MTQPPPPPPTRGLLVQAPKPKPSPTLKRQTGLRTDVTSLREKPKFAKPTMNATTTTTTQPRARANPTTAVDLIDVDEDPGVRHPRNSENSRNFETPNKEIRVYKGDGFLGLALFYADKFCSKFASEGMSLPLLSSYLSLVSSFLDCGVELEAHRRRLHSDEAPRDEVENESSAAFVYATLCSCFM